MAGGAGVTTTEGPEPGWYDDPGGSRELRYWDGAAWTERIRPRPAAAPSVLTQPSSGHSQVAIRRALGQASPAVRAALAAAVLVGVGLAALLAVSLVGGGHPRGAPVASRRTATTLAARPGSTSGPAARSAPSVTVPGRRVGTPLPSGPAVRPAAGSPALSPPAAAPLAAGSGVASAALASPAAAPAPAGSAGVSAGPALPNTGPGSTTVALALAGVAALLAGGALLGRGRHPPTPRTDGTT